MCYKETKDYFNSKAATWDENVNHDPGKIKLILQLTCLKDNANILDIGSGTGVLVDYLEKYGPKKIVELDLSSEMLKQAQSKFNYPNLAFVNESFYDTNLDGFDYVICYSGYPHFMEREKFCDKLFQVLNNNGRFVIAHSQNKNSINNVHKGGSVSKISRKLRDAFEEVKIFSGKFSVDIIVDTDELFVISGVKN